ncbi:hypothetical protein P6709_20100, partial [Jeotgalibacillus sp. ET6]|nr:hypothetical protein [Jeotgalibacillus sp. ET6]
LGFFAQKYSYELQQILEEVLYTEEQLQEKIKELGSELTKCNDQVSFYKEFSNDEEVVSFYFQCFDRTDILSMLLLIRYIIYLNL